MKPHLIPLKSLLLVEFHEKLREIFQPSPLSRQVTRFPRPLPGVSRPRRRRRGGARGARAQGEGPGRDPGQIWSLGMMVISGKLT